MAGVKLESLHDYDDTWTIYPITNESIPLWNELLDGIEVDTAASIMGGGDIAFFSILPHVREKVELIDHAYCSIYYAIGKCRMLEQQTPQETLDALKLWETGKWKEVLAEGNKGLPTQAAHEKHGRHAPMRFSDLKMREVWKGLTAEDFQSFKDNKHKLTFLHGCLRDIPGRGPFDLVYLSNALDYAGREGGNRRRYNDYDYEAEKRYDVKSMVKPGGYVCYTYSRYNSPSPVVKGLPVVAESKFDYYSSHTGSWNYRVAQVPE